MTTATAKTWDARAKAQQLIRFRGGRKAARRFVQEIINALAEADRAFWRKVLLHLK